MKIIRYILSLIYGVVVWVRNLLFDEHLLYSYSPSVPTICVGNLAVGGTGKTPHVEYIVRRLLQEGFRVAVLSRGYKRRTSGFVLADVNATADTIGDEPRQIALKFQDVPVAVCEDRVRGVKRLMKIYPDIDVVVLDDAFQHRYIRCGYSVLLTPADRLYSSDHLLPYGRLREQSRGAMRADTIVVTKCPDSIQPIEQRVIETTLHPAPFQNLCFSWLRYHNLPQERCFLLTAIAQPQYLESKLGDLVLDRLLFRDHHRFTKRDMALVEKRFAGEAPICVTEKDYVRLMDSPFLTDTLRQRLHVVRIDVDFRGKDVFDRSLIRYVKENINHK
ncbi:MAG: tetraacyldisaccharide 4'-kinase [Paludibacteraceae bacterium]|nr:tetraacyldisaccharide 4'-kinase [Paludibacteraceae bacterium]